MVVIYGVSVSLGGGDEGQHRTQMMNRLRFAVTVPRICP